MFSSRRQGFRRSDDGIRGEPQNQEGLESAAQGYQFEGLIEHEVLAACCERHGLCSTAYAPEIGECFTCQDPEPATDGALTALYGECVI
jgi:hypothetical protein